MTNIARHHHFVSQGYLAAFTSDGTKNGQLFAYSKADRRIFKTSTKGIASQRDFNRVDIEGMQIDALEKALAKAEGELLPAVRSVLEKRHISSSDDLIKIINLIALYFVHSPKMREVLKQTHLQSAKLIGYHYANLPENEAAKIELREYLEGDDFNPRFTSEDASRIELSALDAAIEALANRKWTLFEAASQCPNFVCGDHPVTLVREALGSGPIGLGSPSVSVHFPLSPRLSVYGSYCLDEPYILLEEQDNVAQLNSSVYERADRHVYSNTREMVVLEEALQAD